jgi:glycerol-1-phosphate dehydrogenase [NAD(P)+]
MAVPQDGLREAAAKARVTKDVLVEGGALGAIPALATRVLSGRTLMLVADENTHAAAGAAVEAGLDAAGAPRAETLMLTGGPRLKPRVELADEIARAATERDAVPVAVGSGVINDLTKLAAARMATPYLCVPTAASMDGYSASGAALLEDGFKRTFACPPPVAVVADLDVIARAPRRMAAWGYGDLAGKLTAGADWQLADAVGEEAIAPDVWQMVQDPLPSWLAEPEAIRRGDAAAIGGLVEGLLISGLAMQAHGTSRPASGSDHQFSHLWEMEGLAIDGELVAHGICVGLGCLSSLALYEWLCRQDLTTIDPAALVAQLPTWSELEAETRAAFTAPSLAENAVAEKAKQRPREAVERRLSALKRAWPTLGRRLRETLPQSSELAAKLATVGAPTHPAEVGIPPERHRRDYFRARMIRRRFTIFDLLFDLGLFSRAVDDLFDSRGFWGKTAAAVGKTAREEVAL